MNFILGREPTEMIPEFSCKGFVKDSQNMAPYFKRNKEF